LNLFGLGYIKAADNNFRIGCYCCLDSENHELKQSNLFVLVCVVQKTMAHCAPPVGGAQCAIVFCGTGVEQWVNNI